ncbi:amidohydrolase family protein [Falsiroseomonas sp. CW058]|uniref:metal-dependent hydrolase family protein n=1 Tax=Falsiroseomonas sp. CW058 TaxID=3388664 RepID=UPI003D318F2E
MDRTSLDALAEAGRTTILRHARLIDGTGAPPRVAEVAVKDGAILAVGEGLAGDAALDCGGLTLLPGLIDAHAHLIYSGFRSLDEVDRQSVESATINGVLNAAKVLDAGYTTIRDVGTIGNVAATVRDAVEAGKVRGPRVVASGPIICATGGLGDTVPPHWTRAHGLGVLVNGAEAIRAEVRRQIRLGVDNIKLAASGVEVGPYAWTWMTTFSEEEIRVAVEEAHRWGRTVAIHAQSYDSVKFALRAGVDTIEHGTRMDDEAIALFARSDTVLVPTLSTLFSVLELGAKLNLLPKQREEMAVNEPLWLDSFRRARAAGIPIASGADLGNRYPHGANAREIALLVRCGMTPMEALRAATAVAARALRRADRIGTVEAGKAADLLLFDGDPLADIESLQDLARIALVVKGGRAVAGRLARG